MLSTDASTGNGVCTYWTTGSDTFKVPSGTLRISELRTSGPAGAGDGFVEHYHADSPLTIAASDNSAGFGLFKIGADCNAIPVLIPTIPNGTVVPARGHYLIVARSTASASRGWRPDDDGGHRERQERLDLHDRKRGPD